MTLWITPDEAPHLSFLDGIICPGLEALTGADFLLSSLPINPVSNPGWHVENDSIFVNIKRGYDLVVNHDSPKNMAARCQKLGVKPGRMFLLGIGEYREVNGMLSVAGYNKPPSSIPYTTFLTTVTNCLFRGLQWLSLPHSDYIVKVVEMWQEERPSAIVVASKPIYDWTEGDFWQQVVEPPKDSVESMLACGLPDFGPKKAQATVSLLIEKKMAVNLFNALVVLSTIDEKGKAVFKVPGVGEKTVKDIRRYLFGVGGKVEAWNNLSLEGGDYQTGLRTALDNFHHLFQDNLATGIPAKLAYEDAINAIKSGLQELVLF